MKYLEELTAGDAFIFNKSHFILTCDFKNNGQKLCINLTNGLPQWFNANDMVDLEPIYIVNSEGTTISIK